MDQEGGSEDIDGWQRREMKRIFGHRWGGSKIMKQRSMNSVEVTENLWYGTATIQISANGTDRLSYGMDSANGNGIRLRVRSGCWTERQRKQTCW